jgi:hypothetical protein
LYHTSAFIFILNSKSSVSIIFLRYILFEKTCGNDQANALKESKKQLHALADFLHFSEEYSSDIVGKFMFDMSEDMLGTGIPSRFEIFDESLLDD